MQKSIRDLKSQFEQVDRFYAQVSMAVYFYLDAPDLGQLDLAGSLTQSSHSYLGSLRVERAESIEYQSVCVAADMRPATGLKSALTLFHDAGAMLPRDVLRRVGISEDVKPALQWLGFVLETLRKHPIAYVEAHEDPPVGAIEYMRYHLLANPLAASIAAIEQAGLADLSESPSQSQRRKKTRRRNRQRKATPLTVKQAEAVHMIGECKGNIAEAARRLGRDRKTVEQHYKAAMSKMGKEVVKAAAQTMPYDRRGQTAIAGPDDGPAAIGSKSRVDRDQRFN